MAGMQITHLFLDIGNVILTNGWDRRMRQQAAAVFELDYEEMNERHHLTFDTYEEGKLTLDEYLNRTIFYEERSFMFSQSKPIPEMIDLIRSLKIKYGLTVAAISNEGRELTIHRIQTFRLTDFVDFLSPHASSAAGSRMPTSTASPWISLRSPLRRWPTWKIGKCSLMWRKAWESAA